MNRSVKQKLQTVIAAIGISVALLVLLLSLFRWLFFGNASFSGGRLSAFIGMFFNDFGFNALFTLGLCYVILLIPRNQKKELSERVAFTIFLLLLQIFVIVSFAFSCVFVKLSFLYYMILVVMAAEAVTLFVSLFLRNTPRAEQSDDEEEYE